MKLIAFVLRTGERPRAKQDGFLLHLAGFHHLFNISLYECGHCHGGDPPRHFLSASQCLLFIIISYSSYIFVQHEKVHLYRNSSSTWFSASVGF